MRTVGKKIYDIARALFLISCCLVVIGSVIALSSHFPPILVGFCAAISVCCSYIGMLLLQGFATIVDYHGRN